MVGPESPKGQQATEEVADPVGLPLDVLDRQHPHHVVTEEGEVIMPFKSGPLQDKYVNLLAKLDPYLELIVRLNFGIDDPPMRQERIERVLPGEKRSIAEIIAANRKQTTRTLLTIKEIGSVLERPDSTVKDYFNIALRRLKWHEAQEGAQE